jgi:hypothetical protein
VTKCSKLWERGAAVVLIGCPEAAFRRTRKDGPARRTPSGGDSPAVPQAPASKTRGPTFGDVSTPAPAGAGHVLLFAEDWTHHAAHHGHANPH